MEEPSDKDNQSNEIIQNDEAEDEKEFLNEEIQEETPQKEEKADSVILDDVVSNKDSPENKFDIQ